MKDLVIHDRLTIPAAELSIGFARSSGPGGQNVNKVESKVEVRWRPAQSAAVSAALSEADREWLLTRVARRMTIAGELVVTSQKTRDQAKNREDALDKLAALIRLALERPRMRKATRPTKGSHQRRIQAKRHRAAIKGTRRLSTDD